MMKILKLSLFAFFSFAFLGQQSVYAQNNVASQFAALQAEEAKLLAENKELKQKIKTTKEEIAKKKKAIRTGAIIGSIGAVAGGGGLIFARDRKNKTARIEKQIQDAKSKKALITEILKLSTDLCPGDTNCKLVQGGTTISINKTSLEAKSVTELNIIKDKLLKQEEYDRMIEALVRYELSECVKLGDCKTLATKSSQKFQDRVDAYKTWGYASVKEKYETYALYGDAKNLFNDAMAVGTFDEDGDYTEDKIKAQEPFDSDKVYELKRKIAFFKEAIAHYNAGASEGSPSNEEKSDFTLEDYHIAVSNYREKYKKHLSHINFVRDNCDTKRRIKRLFEKNDIDTLKKCYNAFQKFEEESEKTILAKSEQFVDEIWGCAANKNDTATCYVKNDILTVKEYRIANKELLSTYTLDTLNDFKNVCCKDQQSEMRDDIAKVQEFQKYYKKDNKAKSDASLKDCFGSTSEMTATELETCKKAFIAYKKAEDAQNNSKEEKDLTTLKDEVDAFITQYGEVQDPTVTPYNTKEKIADFETKRLNAAKTAWTAWEKERNRLIGLIEGHLSKAPEDTDTETVTVVVVNGHKYDREKVNNYITAKKPATKNGILQLIAKPDGWIKKE